MKALGRVADRADDARAQILESAGIVDDRKGSDVVEERVDGEVAPERVFFRRAKRVLAMDETGTCVAFLRGLAQFGGGLLRGRQFFRCHFAAKGRDLDRLHPEPHVRKAEAPADDPAVLEEPFDLVWMRRRADVEVLWAPAEEQVPYAPAHEIRDVAVLMEAIENFERVGIDLRSGERVCGSLHDDRVTHRLQIVGECATIRLCEPPFSSSLRWF